MSTPLGGGHIIFAFSTVRTLGFRSFEGKVFILSLPNLVWVFIGLIVCIGLLLVKIGTSFVSGHFKEKYLTYLYQI